MNINKIKFFSDLIKERLNNDYDLVVAITGEEGSGKSTLAIQIATNVDSKFDLVKNVAYLPNEKEIEEKFHQLEPKQCFVVDEAIRVFYKLRWMDKLQIRLSQMYMTERWQNKCTFLLIPRFTDLNEVFRNHRVNIWIHVVDRGKALIFKKISENMFGTDPWKMKENEKIIDKYLIKNKKLFNVNFDEYCGYLEKNIPNFVGTVEFDDLDEGLKEEYRRLKAESRPVLSAMIEPKTNYTETYIFEDIKKHFEEGYSIPDIAEMHNVPVTFIENFWKLKVPASQRKEIMTQVRITRVRSGKK